MSDASGADVAEKPDYGARVQALLRRRRLAFMVGAPAVVLVVLGWLILTSGRHQETDNAYVQAARVPISTSITGRIVEIRVHDNERVAAGQVLFVLDRDNYQADLNQAEAALAAARTRVAALRAAYGAKAAGEASARDGVAFARTEAKRARELAAEGIASRQDLDLAAHQEDEATAALAGAHQNAAAALAELGGRANIAINDHPIVREAAARLARARLAVSDTEVVAPQAGIVTRVDQVQRGSFVNAGQTLFWLIAGEPWIEANFKEDQIGRMRVGQSVSVHLDAYRGRKFEGRVASFSPGTGAVFAALPAQNATGNWVKIVQRLPVRIALVNVSPDLLLSAGMSARVSVDTKSAPNKNASDKNASDKDTSEKDASEKDASRGAAP